MGQPGQVGKVLSKLAEGRKLSVNGWELPWEFSEGLRGVGRGRGPEQGIRWELGDEEWVYSVVGVQDGDGWSWFPFPSFYQWGRFKAGLC